MPDTRYGISSQGKYDSVWRQNDLLANSQ